MRLKFRAVQETEPGQKLAGLFSEYRTAYLDWWAGEGLSGRPTYSECRRALLTHMPEMVGLYDKLCASVGGGDMESRFLSFFCPPRYLAGCSQAIWPGKEPLLVRNYDYNPLAFDAVFLKTGWDGRDVMGTSDGLFGLLDGMNDAGLTVSLTFGGRRAMGDGFGVPLILRYLLQVCSTIEEAKDVLRRVPSHMSYNVTVLDRDRNYFTAFLAPDRPTLITHAAVATNHQERVEWASHARLTASVERERFLLQRLTLHPETKEKFVGTFLKPPLYSLAFDKGFGTLYTAAYHPDELSVELLWPGRTWQKNLDCFEADQWLIGYPDHKSQHAV
ncbi:C45 family autoproteolytic acyltransferase/hydolase [Leisingera sp. ANG-M6]|uniref:C45 family autoproteolytic acyltransferase/hydolase n=1 Tax=Leisingera sp. ANG-M6 TaxID=1577900 RepID=UPI00187C2EAF|nr:C45 family peptidase [Leisingera sp. ANG-M6]